MKWLLILLLIFFYTGCSSKQELIVTNELQVDTSKTRKLVYLKVQNSIGFEMGLESTLKEVFLNEEFGLASEPYDVDYQLFIDIYNIDKIEDSKELESVLKSVNVGVSIGSRLNKYVYVSSYVTKPLTDLLKSSNEPLLKLRLAISLDQLNNEQITKSEQTEIIAVFEENSDLQELSEKISQKIVLFFDKK